MDYRLHHTARAAPIGEKIHKGNPLGYLSLKIVIVKVLQRISHGV
jgi:hypothetical protein